MLVTVERTMPKKRCIATVLTTKVGRPTRENTLRVPECDRRIAADSAANLRGNAQLNAQPRVELEPTELFAPRSVRFPLVSAPEHGHTPDHTRPRPVTPEDARARPITPERARASEEHPPRSSKRAFVLGRARARDRGTHRDCSAHSSAPFLLA